MLAPALALVSAALWGAADFAGGIATRRSSNLVVVFIVQAVGLAIAAMMLLLSAEAMPADEVLAWSAFAGLGSAIGLASFYLALSRGTMSLVAPLTALISTTIPALVGLLSGEALGALVLVGMVLAVIAVVVISLPDQRPGSPRPPAWHASRAAEWLLILVAGLGFACFYLFIDTARETGGELWWPLFVLKLSAVASISLMIVVAVPLGRTAVIRVGRLALILGVLAGLGEFGANVLFVLASAEGGLAVVVVLASLYPVTTVLLARIVLHERLGRSRLLGVALAIIGVVLISVGTLSAGS